MPQYQISVPGQGTFRVDSPTELTDLQAWQAVQSQLAAGPVAEKPFIPSAVTDVFHQFADVPIGFQKGVLQGIRMVSDVFGANNAFSRSVKQNEEALAGLMSAQSKNDQQEIARILKEAEDKGVLDQVKAGVKAFTVAPVDTLTSALGTAAPAIVAALGANILGAGALLTTGVSMATGAVMGAGTIKGTIYEETKQALLDAGVSEADAEQRAIKAQEYGGKNLDQILTGAVIGGVAARGPLEKGAVRALASRISKNVAAREAAESVSEKAAKGAVSGRLRKGVEEALPEALQGTQEKVASNIAQQREGLDVPTFRGAVSAGTLEGLAGFGLGAAMGKGKEPAAPQMPPAPPPVAPTVETTAATTPPAPPVAPPATEAPPSPPPALPVAPVAETPAVETPAVETPVTPGVAETPTAPTAETTAPQAPPAMATPEGTKFTFETAKGSQYFVFEDGTTQRNKAPRPEHPGDQGVKERTARTIYVDGDASRLSAAGVTGMEGARVIIDDDGTASLVWKNPQTGELGSSPISSKIKFYTEPAIGRSPLELWNKTEVAGREGYSGMHAGNKIVKLAPIAKTTSAPATPAAPDRAAVQNTLNTLNDGDTIVTDDGDRIPVARVVRNKAGDVTAIVTTKLGEEGYTGIDFDGLASLITPQPYIDSTTGERKFSAPATIEKPKAAAPSKPPAPKPSAFESKIVSRQPAPDGMEVHVFTTTDGYGTGLFDADAGQYVNGSVTRFAGTDTLPKAEARASEMLRKATPAAPAEPSVEPLGTRKEAQAFGKAIGATQPYPGELRGRVNLPAQKAAKEGNFQGVLSALEKSKNVIVAEIAKRARALGTKIVIDDDAEETYTGPSTLMRQMSIDGAKMHLEALNKIREFAPQVDALPDKAELSYAIRGATINAIDGGESAGRIGLEDIAKMGHSMFAPLPIGEGKLRTKEDFKRLQKAYEDLTSEYGENALQLTSTGSAEMRGVAGAYDADTDTIRVPEYTAKREDVLSHEIVHAQTVQAIANPTLRQKPIVARLNKLYEHVKKELEVRPGFSNSLRRAPYGIQSIQEFVAEGMGNPAFQFLLKKIKYENTSAWDSFVQTIANLIGVKRDTAFTELLSIYSELTTEQKAETKVEPSAPAAAAPAASTPFMQRLQEYWGGTVTPAIRNYLDAFNSFGVDRLEKSQIKPAGMTAREWIESFVSKQSTWDKGRRTGVTGIQALSTKNLWPTTDGSGERLRKAMLEAVKALKNAPGSTGELMDQAFAEERKTTAVETTTAEAPPTLDTTGIKEVKGRHPQVQAAAKLLQDKKMTREEFEKYVDYYKPIEEIEAEKLLPPTSEQRMNETVNADKRDRINVPVADGTKVGLRMDLPARERGGSVVSIHEGKPGKMTVGKLMGFRSTGWLKDVTFEVRSQEKGLAVAAGAAKAPQQTVEGTWQNLSPEETYARVKELMKDPAWKQIGFDPSRHGYFYDRKTREPVVSASEMYQVGQFLLAKDVQYAPKENYLYSIEPTIKSDRVPSYKRGVENLRKRWEKGDLTSDEFAGRVDILAKQIETAELSKELSPRERGADYIRQRLLEAKRRGELTAEAVDFAEWFILQNPKLVDDLAISIRTPKEGGVAGSYESFRRLMTLMKDNTSDYTIVHEILHHLERMMPKDVQSAIRKVWFKSLVEAQKKAKTEAEKTFFKNIMEYHFGLGGNVYLKNALDAIKNGNLDKAFYQYSSPSEFWAENGSEIMGNRFLMQGSVLNKLKQWLREFAEKAKDLFGLNSKAPIIRALDSLSKGDGKFVTSTLLDETTEPKFSITPAVTPGQQALETIRNMGMDVPKPDPTKLEKAKDIWQKAKEDPKLTAQSAMKAARDFMDKVETWAFSPDAKLNNDFRRAVIKDFKENEGVLGQLLEMSQSQAVHADALSSQFLIDGGLKYNDDLKKWESFQSKANFPALSKKLDEIGAKYGLTKEQIERVAHTYLVAKRLPGLIERNKNLDAEIAAEQASIKPDKTKIKNLEDKKVFISDKQLEQIEPGMSLVKNIPELNQVVDMWNEIRKNTIDVMVNSGLWSPEYAQAMWDNMDYVPYFREDQIENEAGPQEFIRGLQVKSKEFQLKGSEDAVHDVFDNMIRWTQYAINRSVRAHKALQMVDNVKDIQIGDRKMAVKVTEEKRGMNIARVFRDGKQELYDMADPMYVQAFSAIQNVSIPTLKFMARVSNVLRQSVVLYPLFSVAQVPQDAFAAMFTSGLKTQHALKIPILAVKEFIKTLNKTSQTHETLKRFGATGVRDFSATVIRDDAEIYAGLKPPRGGWGKTKEFLSHISMAADNAVRQAVYEASMQQGVKQSEAIEKAFDIINFRRKGTSKMLNILGQTVPFFYAYLSAQRVALKVLTGTGISPTDRKEAFQTLATTSAAVATLSMLYAMANADDEDYMETPAAIRDRTLTIPGSGGVRIPLRPDFFLFPKIIAEHTYLMISEQGYQDAAKFRTSMKDALISAVASPTPFPTAIKPAIEVAINYDFFQGKPLIGTFEKDKALERQFRDSTSEFAKLLGSTGLVSPIAADHMIRGMFGSFGGLFLYGTNQFLHSDPDVPRPELNATEMLAALPGTSGLLKRPQESALKNDFYTLRDEVEKAVNTFNDIKLRSPQGMEDFLADEKQMARYMLGKPVDQINRQLAKIRRQMTIITNMPENQMSAEDKSDYKRQLMEMERELLRSVDVKALREMAKI